MTATTKKLGADMTDEQWDKERLDAAIQDFALVVQMAQKPEHGGMRKELAQARQRIHDIARQPAAIGKQEVVTVPKRMPGEKFSEWAKRTYDSQPVATSAEHDESTTTAYNPAYVRERFADYESQIAGLKAELAFVHKASPAAPSVEQDERGVFRDTLRGALKSYRRANPSRYLNDDQVDASDSEFVSDLMAYVPVGEKPRAASTSADVAQGAEAVKQAVLTFEDYMLNEHGLHWLSHHFSYSAKEMRLCWQAATPAQPALPDDARDAFIRNVAAQKPEKPDHWSSCGQCEHNIERAQDLLDAAQSASGDTK